MLMIPQYEFKIDPIKPLITAHDSDYLSKYVATYMRKNANAFYYKHLVTEKSGLAEGVANHVYNVLAEASDEDLFTYVAVTYASLMLVCSDGDELRYAINVYLDVDKMDKRM